MYKDEVTITISLDGDHWCALIGPDLQEGVAGFAPMTEPPLQAIRALCDQLELTPWNLKNLTLG